MSLTAINQEFSRNGYAFVKGLLNQNELTKYRELLQNDRRTIENSSWEEVDGVAKNKSFWPLLYNAKLISTLRSLTETPPKYLAHSDIHVNKGGVGWHTDSNRTTSKTDDTEIKTGALRVAIYLQSAKSTLFNMGVIPGTHDHLSRLAGFEKKLWSLYHRFTKKLPPFYIFSKPMWFDIDEGDCLIFDTRILHTGTKPTGPKFSIYLVYGEENNVHCNTHYDYIHKTRSDLGYKNINPLLKKILKEKDLLHSKVR